MMLLDLVTKKLLLTAALSWVLALMVRSTPSWVWWLCVAILMVLFVGHVGAGSEILLPLLAIWIVIMAFYLFFFYMLSKRGFLHSDMGAVVPTAVFGLASTVFPVEVAGTRFFVAVAVFGTLVPLVQNMQCAVEVMVCIQAALVPLYFPYITWPVVLLTC